MISATFARLPRLGVSLRDPRIFDRFLEPPPSVRDASELDAAAAVDSARLLTPEVLAEHVAGGLTESIEHTR